MFDRAKLAIIVTTALAAGSATAVFAAAFALYAVLETALGAAGAAAIVALVAALAVALFALVALMRVQTQRREGERAQAQLMEELPQSLGDFAREHPLLTLAASAVAGVLAARYPALARDLMGVVARFKQD
jgi:hypothetical protein